MTTVDVTGAWYCTEDAVLDALDAAGSRRSSRRIRAALEDGTRWIDRSLNRHRGAFLPITETRNFDWPRADSSSAYRLWLGDNTLTAAPTALTSGGSSISAVDVFSEPTAAGPPYDYLELNIASASSFSTAGTHQHQIAVTGVWGWRADTRPAGALAEALDASETGVDVTDSSLIGVGSVLICGTERMIVTDRTWLDTGQTVITTALTETKNNETVLVTDGTAIHVDERILIGSERMRVLDIAGNTLTVQRAVDGSTLAAHATSSVIYAPRTLTVTRGALGTDADLHNAAAALTVHVIEGPIQQLALAECLESVMQQAALYARDVKQPSGGAAAALGVGIDGIRSRVHCAYRRGPGYRKLAV